jgi:predicted membrane-bound mannosyltransferase
VIKFKRIYLLLIVVLAVLFVMGIVTPVAAQESTARERTLEEIRAAIRAIPEYDKITEADRPAIEKAQRLVEKGMANYGITEYDICTLSAKLGAAISKVGLRALPPTGGLFLVIPIGLLSVFAGAALLMTRKRKY